MTWHAEETQLRRYLSDSLDEVHAWSLEAHLDACSACREQLATLSAGSPVATIVDTVHEQLVLEDQPDRHSRLRQVRMLSGPTCRLSWLTGAALLLLLAVVLDAAAKGGSQPALLGVAPILPLLGVAFSFGPHFDQMYEMTAATPSAGLRLVLLRTVGILVLTVPPATLVGLISGDQPVAWLLPCLALTAGTLALGSVIALNIAAIALGSLWILTVAIPAGAGADTSAAVSDSARIVCLGVIAAAGSLLALRHDYYNRLETK